MWMPCHSFLTINFYNYTYRCEMFGGMESSIMCICTRGLLMVCGLCGCSGGPINIHTDIVYIDIIDSMAS